MSDENENNIKNEKMSSFEMRFNQDKQLRKEEAINWGKKFYGDVTKNSFKLCCVIPSMWHEQESWKINLKIWLNECDCVMFFTESIKYENNPNIGDKQTYSYQSLNKYVGTLKGNFKWILPSNIDKPTLFIDDPIIIDYIYNNNNSNNYNNTNINTKTLFKQFIINYCSNLILKNLDFDIKLSPFKIKKNCNSTKYYWIIPLNKFINNELILNNYWNSKYHNNTNNVPLYGKLEQWDKISSMYF